MRGSLGLRFCVRFIPFVRRFTVEGRQRRNGRRIQGCSVNRKMRSMAGAIPAPLKGVPVEMAADVGASGRNPVNAALIIAIGRNLADAFANDSTLTGF